jgi:hypothetical protein
MLLSCNDNKNSNPTSPSGTVQTTENYSVSGSTLTFYTAAGASTYCYGDSLVVSQADSSVTQFQISGNTLTTFNDPDTNNYGEYLDSNLVYQSYDVFTRISGGPGLTGSWSLTSIGYTVLRGSLTAAEKSSLDSEYSSTAPISNAVVEFSGNTVKIQMSLSYAEFFYSSLNSFYGTGSGITLTMVGANAVRMTGTISGEVVTLTFANNGDETYSSSIQSHAATTVFVKPTTCPNDVPAWFTEFLQANENSGATLYKAEKRKNGLYPHSKQDAFIKNLKSASRFSVATGH